MATAARIASNALLKRWCASLTGDVLSIGSLDDEDSQGRHYRDYFKAASSYTTSEPLNGRGRHTDLVLDVRNMPEVEDERYHVVFCSGVLEHVDDLHAALGELYRILTPGGTLLLGLPFRQALHMVPQDFWRFTEYGVRHLLTPYEQVEVVAVDATDPKFPATYWARAIKP